MNKIIFSLKKDDLKITQELSQSSKFSTSNTKFKIPTTYEMKPFREIKPREGSVADTSTNNSPAIKYTPRDLPPSGRSRSFSNLKAFNADHDL